MAVDEECGLGLIAELVLNEYLLDSILATLLNDLNKSRSALVTSDDEELVVARLGKGCARDHTLPIVVAPQLLARLGVKTDNAALNNGSLAVHKRIGR